jgi:glutamate-ammonia-ligase adenylyltransferase
VRWSDNIRQLEALDETKILEKQTALFLKDAYLTLRSEIHRLSLQEKLAIVPEAKFSDLQNRVKEVWNQYFG